jgi:hypothetical protein
MTPANTYRALVAGAWGVPAWLLPLQTRLVGQGLRALARIWRTLSSQGGAQIEGVCIRPAVGGEEKTNLQSTSQCSICRTLAPKVNLP